jgi:hypothetical protein
LREELNYDIVDLINVYDCVVKSVLEKRQELIFVHGHGGIGKTFLWHTIINRLRSDGLIVLVVASSGIASLLLLGGRIAHSRFKIPLTISDTSLCEIKKKTDLARLLEMTSLIVWDEAPMNNRCCFEALDRSLLDVLTNGNDLPNDKPFGGKSILLGGDFRQILPIIPGGIKEDIVHASLCSSVLWSKFKVLTLTENMRLSSNGLSNDQKKELAIFANWILAIGDGTQWDALFPDD